MQPVRGDQHDTRAVVRRVRDTAITSVQAQLGLAFDLPPEDPAVKTLARFALAVLDGAFVASQSDDPAFLGEVLDHFPAAVLALRATLSAD
jgi:hypothetical protein